MEKMMKSAVVMRDDMCQLTLCYSTQTTSDTNCFASQKTIPWLIFVGPEVASSCSSRCFNYLTETTNLSDARQQQDAHNTGALIHENPLCLH